jgi:transketolase
MRRAVAAALEELAARDPRVVLLTGDLGYMVLDGFAAKYPGRFINAGVAEQDMIGMATGLAEAGFIPFVYSISTFAVLRPYEFIRNGPVQHGLPVRIIGVGSGFDYGLNGMSHYGLEDVGVLRCQADLAIVAPADDAQARTALLATWDLPGPVYYRLAKDDCAAVPGLDGRFALGRAEVVARGRDVLIAAMGTMAGEAVRAAGELAVRGLSATVAVVASVAPPPADDLVLLLQAHPVAVTVEAHVTTGGLGSLVAEVIGDHGLGCRLVRCGISPRRDGVTGSSRFLMEREGLTAGHVAARAADAVARAAAGAAAGAAVPPARV